MLMRTLVKMGVHASLTGDEPTNQADYNSNVIHLGGNAKPTWSEVQAEMLNDTSIADRAGQEIDRITDNVYTKSASRATRYERKHEEAIAYKSAGYPPAPVDADYPFLVRESAERGVTEQELADSIIEKAVAFANFGADIEALRAKLKVDTSAASTIPAKRAAASAILTTALSKAETLLNS